MTRHECIVAVADWIAELLDEIEANEEQLTDDLPAHDEWADTP